MLKPIDEVGATIMPSLTLTSGWNFISFTAALKLLKPNGLPYVFCRLQQRLEACKFTAGSSACILY